MAAYGNGYIHVNSGDTPEVTITPTPKRVSEEEAEKLVLKSVKDRAEIAEAETSKGTDGWGVTEPETDATAALLGESEEAPPAYGDEIPAGEVPPSEGEALKKVPARSSIDTETQPGDAGLVEPPAPAFEPAPPVPKPAAEPAPKPVKPAVQDKINIPSIHRKSSAPLPEKTMQSFMERGRPQGQELIEDNGEFADR